MEKVAIILFNLGGADSPQAVKPFLFNLFNDPRIINLPRPLRYLLAKWISATRESKTKEIYNYLGGKSPILSETEAQAMALEKKLGKEYKVFIAMRYWYPRAEDIIKKVVSYGPKKVILLPLYPQFSTTTTLSSIEEWRRTSKSLNAETYVIGCYYDHKFFINAHVKILADSLRKVKDEDNYKIVFSAHGLPEKIIQKGDPYQFQVEKTVERIMQNFPDHPNYIISYQSKVGRLKWLEPSTEQVIMRAGEKGEGVIIVPISFVSEHSETLVELDIEYAKLAEKHNVPFYLRVETLGTEDLFIECLASMCKKIVSRSHGIITYTGAEKKCNLKECICNDKI